MNEFGELLRELRLAAGYGLRQFAKLIGELPSNLSAIETGARPPWRSMEKLRAVANALALEEGTTDWDRFFIAARRPDALPQDIDRLMSRELNLVLLRTVEEKELTDDQLRKLIEHVRNEDRNGRKRQGRGAR